MKHKNPPVKKILTVLTVVFFILFSCKWIEVHKRTPPKGKNIVCVVDFSDSKNAKERLQFYMNIIKDDIIPKLGKYDKITVIPVDKKSITNSSDILLEDLSKREFVPQNASPIEEGELTRANLKKYIDTLQNLFASNFQHAVKSRIEDNHGTDIFGALSVVQTKFQNTKDNYLIMLSDMMNWSRTLNMEPDSKDFNSSSIDNILNKVPNYPMPNTTALVLTAEQVDVSPEHFQLVESFWTKYFAKNQIKLFDYNSASVDKLNELMSLDDGADRKNNLP